MVPLLFIGTALGGAAMYLFDPQQGRRRRALLRDQAVKAQSNMRDILDAGKRDVSNRAAAVSGRTRSMFKRHNAADRVLVDRVRSRMGRYVAFPADVDVAAHGAEVVLSGYILAHEHSDLIDAIGQVPGVNTVVDRLNVYETAEGLSEVAGSRRRERANVLRTSWTPAVRIAAGAAGTTLGFIALRGGWRGLIYGTAGALLVLRSATNKPLRTLAGKSDRGVVDIEKTIQINAPIEQVFEFIANYENFPQFMRNVWSIYTRPDGRSHWVVAGPVGTAVEFESYVTELVPNKVIAWSTVEGSPVRHAGTTRLQPTEDGTRVHIRMSYTPPAGVLGHAVAKLFGADPKSELDEDMLRLKSRLETGKPPRDAAAWQKGAGAESG
ncbi:MAG: SRPBCC family protein [Burkholderiales bacterium]